MAETLFNDEFLKKLELLFVTSKRVFAGQNQAMRRSKRLGAGIEVADFRPYARGDDLRHVDWHYYASTRELILRLFEEEEDLHIYFLVDHSPSMRVGDGAKLRYARRVAAALAYIGLSNFDRVSIVPFADDVLGQLPPSRGKRQIWKVFRFLEQPFASESTDTGAAFRSFVARTRRRGLVVVISDFYDPAGFERGMDLLRYHRHEPLVFQLWDERELSPDLKGDIELVDCEGGESVRVTVTADLLDRYRQAYVAQLDQVASYCKQRDVLYFAAPVQLPFDELVLKVFRAGGFLR